MNAQGYLSVAWHGTTAWLAAPMAMVIHAPPILRRCSQSQRDLRPCARLQRMNAPETNATRPPNARLDATRDGLVLVLSAASGSGKTTVLRRLLETEPRLAMSVSVTTRKPRAAERRGDHYRFVGEADFDRLVQSGELLEHAEVFGSRYGTPRGPVEARLAQGLDVVADLDWQGAESMRLALGNRCVSVFMLPPSMTELERRIRARAQDSDTTIERRLAKAEEEISHWREFDYVIVNHDLDACVEEIRSVVRVEQIRRRGKSIGSFIETMLRT